MRSAYAPGLNTHFSRSLFSHSGCPLLFREPGRRVLAGAGNRQLALRLQQLQGIRRLPYAFLLGDRQDLGSGAQWNSQPT